MGFIKEAWTKL